MKPGESATSRFSSRPRTSAFQKDLDSYYALMDIQGFFRNIKISCVLMFKDIIPANILPQSIIKDLLSQLQKVGRIVKSTHKGKSVWIQYERVEYAQIAYIILTQSHKYDGKPINVSFYDPIAFADEF